MRFERPLHFGHGGHAPNGSHVALVEVAEWRPLFAGEVCRDHFAHVVAHLHRRLRHSRNLVCVLLKVGQVAKDKNLRQARRIQPVIHNHASALVERRAQHFAERRRLHAGGPQRDRGVDSPVYFAPCGLNPSRSDTRDLGVRMNFHA